MYHSVNIATGRQVYRRHPVLAPHHQDLQARLLARPVSRRCFHCAVGLVILAGWCLIQLLIKHTSTVKTVDPLIKW